MDLTKSNMVLHDYEMANYDLCSGSLHMVPTGPSKREKSLNLKKKNPGLEKSLIFLKNINKPG